MQSLELAMLYQGLTTPHVADACLRQGVKVRCGPSAMQAVSRRHCRFVGRVIPARHYGSVDVFLEAMENAQPGDVLAIDNRGRTDEACIGDLVALEAKQAGLSAIVVWGLHRDTSELLEIGLPVFSLGAIPTGPLHLEQRDDDALQSAATGPWIVTSSDVALGDENGVLFIPLAQAEVIARAAQTIRETEYSQAAKMKDGTSLRTQLQFSEYLARRTATPALSFRQHLRTIGGAVEE
jgi:regulator of RNase E activity RraA